jgi:hypothetical protein
LLIFAKLSTITGATWIFGLLYAWTNMVVFSYMFIVLNAGQGVFIMFAFIFNRRVFQMIKQVCINKNDIQSLQNQRNQNMSDLLKHMYVKK